MKRYFVLAYGIICYAAFLVTFLYTVGFLGDFIVPKTINAGPAVPLAYAIVLDALLVCLFGIQHSGMARRGFKRLLTRVLPRSMERSTYVLFTCAVLGLLFWQWKPIPVVVWNINLPWIRWVITGIYGAGWVVVLVSAKLISSGHLFGLKQVRAYVRGKELQSPEFQTPGFYRYVRHPLMVGFLMVFWATPTMTAGHLLFATLMTSYILAGIQFEERDLISQFGERYRKYRKQVPMLIPLTKQTQEN
ncbi:MAG: isoprenylcysteine carboxylmethyltransferase family protein [Candidatus Marinimicrobia bacterium]|nr:isoprenylcysteine carboxylmethyltransferase family protein [Candidatus Neomarinimicrobiota bacterium]MCF7829735.1 isoprenylcysteine carboxylmethyltransferase family protein [Candidatus Neomarinimicrobiota bacterium]MCF7881685.1 isoprenylcysteine carboxylmethyltransferase family protein [Candidatus Neomarinimicrobiota bacterium]